MTTAVVAVMKLQYVFDTYVVLIRIIIRAKYLQFSIQRAQESWQISQLRIPHRPVATMSTGTEMLSRWWMLRFVSTMDNTHSTRATT